MKGAGVGMIVLGLLIMSVALLIQPTVSTDGAYGVPSQVYNLGALQYQELFFIGGAALLVTGCVLFGFGELIDSLVRAGTAKAASEDAPTQSPANKCGWCERTLDPRYRTCTSMSAARLREVSPQVKDEVCLDQLRARGLLSKGPA